MCRCYRGAARLLLSALFASGIAAGEVKAAQPGSRAAQTAGFACVVGGTVSAGNLSLPGVSVTAVAVDSSNQKATSTGSDGRYRLTLTAAGRYDLTLQLPGFDSAYREIDVPAIGCPVTFDANLVLASRGPQPVEALAEENAVHGPHVAAPGSLRKSTPTVTGATGPPGTAGRRTWDLMLQAGDDQADAATRRLLPAAFAADAATESVAVSGSDSQTNDPLLFDTDFRNRGAMNVFNGGAFGVPFGGPGGSPGVGGATQGGANRVFLGVPGGPGPGGPGGFGPGGFGGGMRAANRVRLTAFYTLGGSPLDAAPYPLTGQPASKPDYLAQRFGVVAGGPLGIPRLFDKTKTTFFLNYTGNHSSSAYDSYSTVPTVAERGGDLSAVPAAIFDPSTGQPFPGNQIPASRQSATALALLNIFPAPNLPGSVQNFHNVTTSTTSLDDLNFRLIRSFGSTPIMRMGGVRGMLMAGAGRGSPLAGIKNLTLGIHYHRSVTDTPNPFPSLATTAQVHAWDVPVNYAFSAWSMLDFVHARYNRNQTQTLGNFAFTDNVAGAAGIAGASRDPFDWTPPNLSFSSLSSLKSVSPSERLAQTVEVGDTMLKMKGRHTLRFGGDYRAYLVDSRLDQNAAGSFVFTGLYTAGPGASRSIAGTGSDLADFLLGLPQQATVQYGPGTERFRGRSWALFLQDDWRVGSKVTLNLGARYEFVSPYWETSGRLVTLDVSPAVSAAVPVQAGGVAPFSGPLPSTVVRPDYRDIAPRLGLAWRVAGNTVVRVGYGISYNANVYSTIAQQLAAQPPFAVAATNLGTPLAPLSLQNALLLASPTATTNTFAVDPNYRLGYVQIWNADLQRNLGRTAVVDIAYTGTRGANLDLLRAPNRGPAGLLDPNLPAFILESSQATSMMNAASLHVQKRLASGFSASAMYTYSRAFDDASTVGGGTPMVAQNDRDLAAEWGPSSFDQPHQFQGVFTYELPFGPGRRWLTDDTRLSALLSGWQVAGNVSIASGVPFTPRVIGALGDVAGGVNGTLRPDYTGAPIALAAPTITQWFNTAAFVVPPAGQFGNAGRNSIRGPTTKDLDVSLSKDIRLGGTASERGLNVRLQATNVLNTPQFSVIDTAVNSPTFGRVIGVLPMRAVQVVLRFRY